MSELYDIHGEAPIPFVEVSKDRNSVTFTIQEGPRKDSGVNGCQIDAVIEFAKSTIEAFSKGFPCQENTHAIAGLDNAIHWLKRRTKNRERRGVEGSFAP